MSGADADAWNPSQVGVALNDNSNDINLNESIVFYAGKTKVAGTLSETFRNPK